MSSHGLESLAEVLAHLDVIYDNLNTAELSTNDNDGSAKAAPESRPKNPGPNFVRGVPYTTEYQRRRKVALQALKLEKDILARELSLLLQKSKHDSAEAVALLQCPEEKKVERQWRARAILNCEKRVRSEFTNLKLKAILSEHNSLFESMRKVIEGSEAITANDLLGRPTADRPFFQVDFGDSVLAELTSGLHRLHFETDSAFSNLEACHVILRSDIKEHETHGTFAETSEVTPLSCSVQEAAKLLWAFSTTSNCKAVDSILRQTRTKCPMHWETSDSRSWIMSALFPESSDKMLRIDAVITSRQYKHGDRIVQVGAVSWFFPTEGLQFIEEYLTVISPSPTDPVHSSVVRTRFQLKVKIVGSKSTRKQVMMNALRHKGRCYLQVRQNFLLEQASPVINGQFCRLR